MDLKQLAAALMAGTNAPTNFGANVNDTAANTGQMQNIRNLAGLLSKGDISSSTTKSLGVASGQQADNEAMGRKVAAQQAEEEERKKREELERLQDPDEYKQIVNDKGGYDFFDPLGNKITAVEFARKRNMQISDVYKDSQDPEDKDFIDDYNRVMDLGRALQSGDKEARDKIYKDSPEFKEKFHNWKYADIVKELHRTYPGYFRSQAQGQRPEIAGYKSMDLGEYEDPDKKKKSSNVISGLFNRLFGD